VNTALHFSSATAEWSTPQWLFDQLNAEFHFNLDVCATQENTKCSFFYGHGTDGLAQPWTGACWMNPPYGREIGKWVQKAWWSAEHNDALVVCLLPARTDTAWWHDFVAHGEIRFLRGRLKFGDASAPAPFPSAIVIFGGDNAPCVPGLVRHVHYKPET